jgi:predicted nuclease of restriction endonuclease-like (RecB) superfamily
MSQDLAHSFAEVAGLIRQARQRAYVAVNTAQIDLYWQVGSYISAKIAAAAWGDGAVDGLAAYLAERHPDLKGFSRPNLFRMRQFYEAYREGGVIVATLLRQLPWSHNLAVLGRCKTMEERRFYLETAARERWSFRELERQLAGGLFLRAVANPPQASAVVATLQPDAGNVFKDSYLLDFLDLPQPHSERDLRQGIVADLRRFLLELGRDFCFVGEEYRIQIGTKDFHIDLLFFHRGMSCLVAFELKVGEFTPADLGQLSFYLEALDRDHTKPHERPAIGVLLCAGKDRDVVEYALSRTLSPALVADYGTAMPPKALLEAKLAEFHRLEDGRRAARGRPEASEP